MEAKIVVNVYWNDLTTQGQDSLRGSGFEPSEEQISEDKPIGVIATNRTESEVDAKLDRE